MSTSFEQFLEDYTAAVKGEYEPLLRWGVHLTPKDLTEGDESLVQSVARQMEVSIGWWDK